MRTRVGPLGCLRFIVAVAPAKAALTFALMLAAFLTEGVGLLLLVPLLSVVGLEVQQGALGGVARVVESAFDTVGIRPTLLTVLGAYVAVTGARTVLGRSETIATARLNWSVHLALQERLYRVITSLPWPEFARRRTSNLAHALTSELDRASVATSQLVRSASQLLITLVYAGFAVFVSPPMAATAVASGLVLALLLSVWHGKATRVGEQISDAGEELFSTVTQHLGAMKTTKSFGAEERNMSQFSRAAATLAGRSVQSNRDYATVTALHNVGSVLILSLLVFIGVRVLGLPTAAILLLLLLFARLVPRISALHQSYVSVLSTLPAFGRVTAMIDRFSDMAEPVGGVSSRIPLKERVTLDGVRFTYADDGARPALDDVSLTIVAHETTAIVGPSGAGKSTIADLVMGLLAPQTGSVRVDGAAILRDSARRWRGSIGYVPQDGFLFHDSVRENLRWARPGATEPELWEALRLSAAAGFVSALPRGLDTVIGDRGVLLSGGERQRIALARALLCEPSLLILDEATSSLDSENEKRIQAAIDQLHGRMTILIITHRLSTVREADNIYVLDAGRVVESGDWDELLGRATGRFRALCDAMGMAEEIPFGSDRAV